MKPIDAVISWVDGYDPEYQAKLNAFCLAQGLSPKVAIEPTRYQQWNEIYYCLLGLMRNLPWLRRIYILTNAQTPSALEQLPDTAFRNKIKIIDQNVLLNALNVRTPIFNSLGVEWLIWHIPNLSEQFLYLNDDFFVIRPVHREDFFRQDRLVLRGDWKTQTSHKWINRMKAICHIPLPKLDPHRAWQEKSAQMAGFKNRYYLLPHAPFPLHQKTASVYMEQHEWISNLNYAFRDPKHLSSVPFFTHLDIKANRVVYDDRLKTVMVNPAHHAGTKIEKRLHHASKDEQVAFVCMQSLDQASSALRHSLLEWLDHHLVRAP